MLLESHSKETRLILLDLRNDIIVLPANQGDAMGRFMPIVAQNINMGRSYKFLLPTRLNIDWKDIAIRMRTLLRTRCSADSVNGYCEIRATDVPIFGGLAVYRLDVPVMRSAAPVFYEMIKEFIANDDWAANAIPPHGSTYAAAMLDDLHLKNARRQFDYLWKSGTCL